jgi:hypothetical protein
MNVSLVVLDELPEGQTLAKQSANTGCYLLFLPTRRHHCRGPGFTVS